MITPGQLQCQPPARRPLNPKPHQLMNTILEKLPRSGLVYS